MTDQSQPKRPIAERQVQAVRAKIWENAREHGVQHSTTFSKVYRDKEGNVREGQSFGSGDLPALSHISGWALDEIQRRREQGREKSSERNPSSRSRRRDHDRAR